MGANDNSFAGKLVYVCGRSTSTSITENYSIKGRLVSDLSRLCFVRTHASPVQDMVDSYCAIASSNAFVFTLNMHTICDPECLNQLGVAILYNIPIVTVREEGYELPKPLPLRFYETKFIDKRMANHGMKKDSSDGPSTLAGVLVSCYENAIVCKRTSYASFLADVIRSLPSIHIDANGNSEQSTSEEEGTSFVNDARSSAVNRTNVVSGRMSKRTARATTGNATMQKQRGLENIYGVEQKLLNRQMMINRVAYKKLDLNFSTCSPVIGYNRKPQPKAHGRQAFRNNLNSAKRKENIASNEQDQHKLKERVRPGPPKEKQTLIPRASPPERVKTLVEISKTTSISAQELNVDNDVNKNSDGGLAVPIIGPKGRKLRRYSSLPVVPTQYLVASDTENGSPQIMSFPPSNNNYHLSTGGDSPLFFSGDDLDFDSIHISRACTPVEALDGTSRSESPEDSSR